MAEKITELKLLNGESVKIQTPISLYEWKKAKVLKPFETTQL